MESISNVHVLPCLIKEQGPADVARGFSDGVFSLNAASSDAADGLCGFTLLDVCGQVAETVPFQVEVTEHMEQDVYASQHGTDPLLGRERLCAFLRGRCLRGSQLDLSALGCRLSMVEVSPPSSSSSRKSPIASNPAIRSQTLRETAEVKALTVWDQDRDISPLEPFLAGYKHIALASALSDYSGEREFVERSGN
ncbi:hypothetical protein, conserved [Babesia bigemina]|uniref:Uncharacterized protein n=1 Tax=Babesia bigemina TaxID=5866 RepID=A0A061D1R8_BABBI|nr:hypothetical protein, conserved [Babesia bigemina]CDR94077.1 hypothetical protein, conserved [Babesia bigemina]|eukprot:XP_012766263.1 hypothetical protein, conserved [Babesia bigemina]